MKWVLKFPLPHYFGLSLLRIIFNYIDCINLLPFKDSLLVGHTIVSVFLTWAPSFIIQLKSCSCLSYSTAFQTGSINHNNDNYSNVALSSAALTLGFTKFLRIKRSKLYISDRILQQNGTYWAWTEVKHNAKGKMCKLERRKVMVNDFLHLS